MALDPTEFVVAGDGRIYVAPVGTAQPLDITVAPSATWVDLGYTTPDATTFKFDRDITDIMVWQSRESARAIITAEPKSVAFELLQINKVNWAFALGGGTTSGAAGAYLYTPPTPGVVDERALIIEWYDGANDFRFMIPRGMQNASVTFSGVRDDAVMLPIEFKILAPPTGVTNAWTMQTNSPDFA